jgi:hypothetical protein
LIWSPLLGVGVPNFHACVGCFQTIKIKTLGRRLMKKVEPFGKIQRVADFVGEVVNFDFSF